MNIDVRIKLQNLVWNKLRVTIPNHDKLIEEFEKLDPELLPQTVEEVEPFFTNHYVKFVEPLPGLVRSDLYMRDVLEKDGFTFEPIFDNELGYARYYVDQKTKTYWSPYWGRDNYDDPPMGYFFQGLTFGLHLGV